MLDFGWLELFVIMAVAILVIGPNEIPALMVGLGRIVRRIQYVKYAFTQQFEDFMQASDLKDIQDSVNFEAGRQKHDFDEAEADIEQDQEGEEQITPEMPELEKSDDIARNKTE